MLERILTEVKKQIISDDDVLSLTKSLQTSYYDFANTKVNDNFLEKLRNDPPTLQLLTRIITNVIMNVHGSNEFIREYARELLHAHSTIMDSTAIYYTDESLKNFLSPEQKIQQLLLLLVTNIGTVKKYKETT